jgi:hypothetical protein
MIVKFDRSFLVEKLSLPYSIYTVLDEITELSRWNSHHRLVFRYEDVYYETTYQVGLTEYQDQTPWDGEAIVECFVVEPYEKIVVDYRAVKN